MSTSELTKQLESCGLSEKEAKIYLSLLSLENATVVKLANSTKISRTTIYDVLERLKRIGLVSVLGRKPKQTFFPESPNILLEQLRQKERSISEKIEKAQELLPQLQALKGKRGTETKVSFHYGKEGLKHVYEDTLTAKKEYFAWANYESMHSGLPGYFPEYYKRRVAKNIFGWGIITNNYKARQRMKKNKSEMRDIALVSQEEYGFSPEITVYNDRVMIASWEEQLGIIIQSQDIADTMKKIFKMCWKEAKREHEKVLNK